MDSVEKLPNYQALSSQYEGRTRNDVNEEIFVEEVSKHLVGSPSALDGMDEVTEHEISYHVKRLLDTVLMGQDSVQSVPEDELYTMTFRQLT